MAKGFRIWPFRRKERQAETVEEFEPPYPKVYARPDYAPDKEVVKSVKGELSLECSICQSPAVVVTVEGSDVFLNSALRRFPIWSRREGRVESLLEDLRAGRSQEAHQAMWKSCDGLDYYCPDCDLLYCADHYEVLPSFDDGFYDCSHARCPNGHERIMDD
ncbi:MAG: hypothetical protein IH956_02935 [Chloroflexi bacterium]|nr:hypothetical protein [Chloroflexota bacterium]